MKVFPMLPLIALLLGVTTGACSSAPTHERAASQLAGEATYDPAPNDPETVASQLLRFKGQSQFLNPEPYAYRGGGPRDSTDSSRAAAGGQRQEQEADIFKIGPEGSKLLYLLNNYRGLQVISYEDGPEEPRLIGRVEATGNWPDQMYFDEEQQRLLVLERVWYDDNNNHYNYSDIQSRLIIYDVSVPTSPRISSKIEIKGEVADSRIVGDILYVASSVRPSYMGRRQGNSESAGYVTSFKLSSQVEQVDQTKLQLATSRRENMNIVEVEDQGIYSYYLVAVLSQSGFGWWDRQSAVEVIDISNENGKIAPLMLASAKGFITERSQTHIQGDTLIVTSNYQPEGGRMRVAVESFSLPTTDSEIIDATEAEYRKLHIERTLNKYRQKLIAEGISGVELEDRLDAKRLSLLADAELGLKGRFIQEEGSLTKPVADQVATVGSSQGLNANLQDVRYHGDKLYVFWVPANNIDPLDVFDISNPAEKLTHLAHLEFDGWIQRAIPMTYKGREYIIGLGWVIPPVNNERQRRYPQLALFEITENAQGVKAEQVSQISLKDSRSFANFNASDKEIEIRLTAEGEGVIMFLFSSWQSGSYEHGGKLVGFDLTDLENSPVFTEGSVLAGSEGWLRRIFTNPEIERVNSFSDQALATFDVEGQIGAAGDIKEAAHVLELARNVRAYEVLGKHGVQIISEYSWYGQDASTELRLVNKKHADAEKPEISGSTELSGTYMGHVVAAGRLFVMTQSHSRRVLDDQNYRYETHYAVYRLGVTAGNLNIINKVLWTSTEGQSYRIAGNTLQVLPDGRVVASTYDSLKIISHNEAADLVLDGCNVDGQVQIQVLEGNLLASYSEKVADPEREGVHFVKRHVAPVLATRTNNVFLCQPAINVPGTVISYVPGSHLVTEDSRLIDIVAKDGYYEQHSDKALVSLRLQDQKAVLKDLYDPEDVTPSAMQVNGDEFVFVESDAQDLIGPWRGSIRMPWTQQTQTNKLSTLSLDEELSFVKTSYVLDLEFNGAAQLWNLSTLATGESIALIGSGRLAQVFSIAEGGRPELRQVQKAEADRTLSEPSDLLRLKSGYYYWWQSQQKAIHFDPQTKSFAIAENLFGVSQYFLAE